MNWALQLSKQYQPKDGQADMYGIILYTEAHAHVKKVLQDEDYWRSLNEISGPQWAIFAVRAKPGAYKNPPSSMEFLPYMVPVWKEPAANRELLIAFELESTEKLPLFLVFNMTKVGEIHKITISIDDGSIEKALHSLKEVIEKITLAIRNIDLENLECTDGLYSAVDYAIRDYKDKKILRNGLKLWRSLRSL